MRNMAAAYFALTQSGFLVLNPSTAKSPAAICTEAVELVRRQIGPTTGFQSAFVVKALPRTRSGKVSRALIRDIAEARNSGTLLEGEDPKSLKTSLIR